MQQAPNLAMDLGGRTTLPRTPRMDAICERVIGTLRRELLDRILILNEHHLAVLLQEYLIHYNGHRPHQSHPCPAWWWSTRARNGGGRRRSAC
ncbi:integrase core domain-containing protein [Nonomuraea angiospora]|uniref:integrase core domain-containing protein n=1 Tax=Nonomuraea angiospora TaxID=46172 RepID=UPI0037BDC4A2